MIIILKKNATPEQIEKLTSDIHALGVSIHKIEGEHTTVFGLVGDTSRINANDLSANEAVEAIHRVQEPYKMANRKFHPENTVIQVGEASFGGDEFPVIAGPC